MINGRDPRFLRPVENAALGLPSRAKVVAESNHSVTQHLLSKVVRIWVDKEEQLHATILVNGQEQEVQVFRGSHGEPLSFRLP